MAALRKAAARVVVGANVVRLDVGVAVAADDQGGQTVGVVNLGRGVVVGMGEGVAGVAAKHVYILPKQRRWRARCGRGQPCPPGR